MHFIKVNFDGASKGNPRTIGYGVVLRNSSGEILGLDAGFLGDTTNNVAELTGLLRGLQSTVDKGYQKIILEGDSQVIIRLTTKILHGCHPEKISPRWRLYGLLEDFNHLLQPHLSITTSHVKQEAKKVANCLENEAVETEVEHFCWEAHISLDPDIFTRCQTLATKELQSPDGVTRCALVQCGSQPGRGINASTGQRPLRI